MTVTEVTARLSQDSPYPYTPSAIFGPGAGHHLEAFGLRGSNNLRYQSCGVDARYKEGGARYELLPFDVYRNPLGLNLAGLWR
jgi:hypothetical protein